MDGASIPNKKPFLLAWCICLVIMELVGAGFASSGIHASFDFRSFYSAGYLVRTHPSKLYDVAEQERVQDTLISKNGFLPFYHPDFEALMYAPFSILNYRAAYLAFIAFNMLLLMAAFFVARPVFSTIIPWFQPEPGLMFFWFLPLLIAIVHGQDSILSLLLYCLTWRSLESGKDMSAGCFLALTLFKFQLAVPIAVLVAMRRGWRFSAGFLITSVGVVLLCILVVGPTEISGLTRLLVSATSAIDKSAVAQHGMGVFPSGMPNIAGLLYGCGARLLPSPLAFNVLVGTCSLGLFVWCMRMVRWCDLNVAFSIAILCGVLVSYHLFVYDLTLTLLPVALLAGRIPRYILLALFGLPFILIGFGSKWFFPLAVPVLAMMVYTLIFVRKSTALAPDSISAAV